MVPPILSFEISTEKKSGKSPGNALIINLRFLNNIRPPFLTPGEFPSNCTGILIVTGLSLNN